MPSQDHTVFVPALTRRGLSYRHFGLYQPNLGTLPAMPAWTAWALLGTLGVLAVFRKIPWWLAGAGAVGTWWLLRGAAPGGLRGTVTLANGTTLPLAPDATLSSTGGGGQALDMTVNGVYTTYPVLSLDQDPTSGAYTLTALDNGSPVPVVS